jgi:hypothetical protein
VSKKARQRRAASSVKPASTPAEASLGALVDDKFCDLWGALAAGDLLAAELETATLMAVPLLAGGLDTFECENFVASVVVDLASDRPNPDGAAFLRLLISLGSPVVKRAAIQALATLTDDGIYPPEWAAPIGKAVPGEAWRAYDVFGDFEVIVVTFGYGDTEHAILVQVDLTGLPVTLMLAVAQDAAGLIKAIQVEDGPFDRVEQIHLAQARRHIEAPLARCDEDLDPELSVHTIAYLPVARSRARRLPADAPPARTFTAADRAAAVDDFMSSPQAAQAGGTAEAAGAAGSVRFWAEILTGYSSRVSGESPTQVGPHRLSVIFLAHVPTTFTVSAAQRDQLEPAVTAWIRWAAARQGLDETATAYILERLPEVLADFDAAYDDPEYRALRGYRTDLAASDDDLSQLAGDLARRGFAVPFPNERANDETAFLDAGDPANRGVLVTEEFGCCTPPDGMTSEQFVAAVQRVIEELWHDDPPACWQTAQRMLADGSSRHEVMHTLATQGSEA